VHALTDTSDAFLLYTNTFRFLALGARPAEEGSSVFCLLSVHLGGQFLWCWRSLLAFVIGRCWFLACLLALSF
jgi:hypothetical protein